MRAKFDHFMIVGTDIPVELIDHLECPVQLEPACLSTIIQRLDHDLTSAKGNTCPLFCLYCFTDYSQGKMEPSKKRV